MQHPDWKQEAAYATAVQQTITALCEQLQTQQKELQDEVFALGEDYALDNRFNRGVNLLETVQMQYQMDRQYTSYYKTQNELYLLQKMHAVPYFGSVDFRQSGDDETQRLYFGLKNLYRGEDMDPLVCDWRAPVASLYYDAYADCSRAQYQSPVGAVTGELTCRRQYQFENGSLRHVVDTEARVDDAILLQALTQDANATLKVIIGSIQRDQNAAIRYKHNKNLAVFGPAGSGKTSVGMHRLAYLLYHNRETLTSQEILLITGNRMFGSYIAGVIPELGEQAVESATFCDLLREALLENYTIEEPSDQLQAFLAGESVRCGDLQLVYSDAFLAALEQAAARPAGEFSDMVVYDDIVVTHQEIEERFSKMEPRLTMQQKHGQLLRYYKSQLRQYFIINEKPLLARLEQELPPHENEHVHFRMLRQRKQKQLEQMLYKVLFPDIPTLYLQVLQGFDEAAAVRAQRRLEKEKLLLEDALCLAYLKGIHGSLSVSSKPKHILIDEAQDLCPLAHKLLRMLFPKSHVTLLADTNQALAPQLGSTDANTLAEGYGCHVHRMERSYRSTKPINDLALALLDGPPYPVFAREGEPPRLLQTQTPAETILALLQEWAHCKTICILTKSNEQARQLYGQLREKTQAQLVTAYTENMQTGVLLMPISLAKGLEFDAVIVPFADEQNFSDETAKRCLYLMTTRALHKLAFLYTDTPAGHLLSVMQ